MTIISREINILEWWEQHKMKIPLLFQVAEVVLAVPATQVSVERVFSALEIYFITIKSTSKVRNILFVRLKEKSIT